MKVEFEPLANVSGDPRRAAQGFGRLRAEPTPAFDPAREADAACAHFEQHGFVVLANCLTDAEIAQLNEFCDRSQAERAEAWGLSNQRKPHHRSKQDRACRIAMCSADQTSSC